MPGLVSQVASCAREGVAGSVQAKASADEARSAARNRLPPMPRVAA